jgi:hypothetical protein
MKFIKISVLGEIMKLIIICMSLIYSTFSLAEHWCIVGLQTYIRIMSSLSYSSPTMIVMANGNNKSTYENASIEEFDENTMIESYHYSGDKSFWGNPDSKLKAVVTYKKNESNGLIPEKADFYFSKDYYFKNETFKDVKCFQF